MTAISVPPTDAGANRRSLSLNSGLVDAAFTVALGVLGLYGFRSLFGGAAYLVVGLLGLVLGIAVTGLVRRLGQPAVTEPVVTLVIFLLLGGALASRGNVVAGVVPTLRTFSTLGHVGIYGWKELLTISPPIGNSSNLLALPYAVGLIGGVAAQSIARRTRSVVLPLIGPVLILALGILFGSLQPASLLLQGAVFGGVALAWTVVRHHRYRPLVTGRSITRDRAVVSVVLLAIAAVVAGVIGPHLPGAGRQRVILSRYVVPPFEANQQPSPLSGFRQYAKGGALNQTMLFTVKGVPPGTLMRIATMDSYDGIDWGFGTNAVTTSALSGDAFKRYGTTIPTSAGGATDKAEVTIGSIGGVWVPDIGQLTSIHFEGPTATRMTMGFVYDAETSTAAESGGVQRGTTYRLISTVARAPKTTELRSAAPGNVTVEVTAVPAVLKNDATQWAAGSSGAWNQVMAIAKKLLTTGYYSDGADATAGPDSPVLSTPGHGLGRLATFLQGGGLVGTDIVGDDEQYAATMALMADSIGVPARVVLGAQVPAGGIVTGADVHAWVEVNLSGFGWVPIGYKDFLPTRPAHKTQPSKAPRATPSSPVQPPVVSALRSPLGLIGGANTSATSHFAHPVPHPGFHIPAWIIAILRDVVLPLAIIAAIIALIVGLKGRRRFLRRRATTTSSQIAGGWAELLDLACDLGVSISLRRTRREQALVIGSHVASQLAVRADAAVFGPGEPTLEQAREYWAGIQEASAELRRRLGRWARWRAALSLRSLRRADTTSGAFR